MLAIFKPLKTVEWSLLLKVVLGLARIESRTLDTWEMLNAGRDWPNVVGIETTDALFTEKHGDSLKHSLAALNLFTCLGLIQLLASLEKVWCLVRKTFILDAR